METNDKTVVIKDLKEKSVLVSREFNAQLHQVWLAYTKSNNLEQWWVPQPWKAETKSMNFTVGGHWLYAMVSPENEKHWGRMDYTAIKPQESFEIKDSFCDEDRYLNTSLPVSIGSVVFSPTDAGTLVEFKMFYTSEKEVETMIEMGFEQGITACLEQLEMLFLENKI